MAKYPKCCLGDAPFTRKCSSMPCGLPWTCACRHWSVEVNHDARRNSRARALDENIFRVCESTNARIFSFASDLSLCCATVWLAAFSLQACFQPSGLHFEDLLCSPLLKEWIKCLLRRCCDTTVVLCPAHLSVCRPFLPQKVWRSELAFQQCTCRHTRLAWGKKKSSYPALLCRYTPLDTSLKDINQLQQIMRLTGTPPAALISRMPSHEVSATPT